MPNNNMAGGRRAVIQNLEDIWSRISLEKVNFRRPFSLFQALGSWRRAKTSEKRKRGRRLVRPHFFSRSPFFSLPATESLEQARDF